MSGIPEMPESAEVKIYSEESNDSVDWRTKGVV
jgi:hypothetical protein